VYTKINWLRAHKIEITFSYKCKAIAILDTGSEVNLLYEWVYIKIINSGINILTWPLEGVMLITAFGKRSNKVRKQAMVEFTIGEGKFEGVFMVSPQLTNDVILGCQFLEEYTVSIDLKKGKFNIHYRRLL
jgi:hypothetical protein